MAKTPVTIIHNLNDLIGRKVVFTEGYYEKRSMGKIISIEEYEGNMYQFNYDDGRSNCEYKEEIDYCLTEGVEIENYYKPRVKSRNTKGQYAVAGKTWKIDINRIRSEIVKAGRKIPTIN